MEKAVADKDPSLVLDCPFTWIVGDKDPTIPLDEPHSFQVHSPCCLLCDVTCI